MQKWSLLFIVTFAATVGAVVAVKSASKPTTAEKSQQRTKQHGLLTAREWVENSDNSGDDDSSNNNNDNKKQSNNQWQSQSSSFNDKSATLEELYTTNNADVLLNLDFGRDSFERWNPRNNNSELEFRFLSTGYPADNAEYILPNESGPSRRCVGSADSEQPIIDSVPFNKYYSKNDPRSDLSCDETGYNWKTQPTVSRSQRLVARLQIKCYVKGADENPFPKRLVRNVQDLRFAACVFGMEAVSGQTVPFFAVTNTDVWAVYPSFVGKNFNARRRVARRRSYDELVDIAVEYDSVEQKIHWYVNGENKWTVGNLGYAPPRDGKTKIDFGQGTEERTAPIKSFIVAFGNHKYLELSDSDNMDSQERLVHVKADNSTFYTENDLFWDNDSMRKNNFWGQGAKMTMFKLQVLRTKATAAPDENSDSDSDNDHENAGNDNQNDQNEQNEQKPSGKQQNDNSRQNVKKGNSNKQNNEYDDVFNDYV